MKHDKFLNSEDVLHNSAKSIAPRVVSHHWQSPGPGPGVPAVPALCFMSVPLSLIIHLTLKILLAAHNI